MFEKFSENLEFLLVELGEHGVFADFFDDTLVSFQCLFDLDGIIAKQLGRRIDGCQAAADDESRQTHLQVRQRWAFERAGQLQSHQKVGSLANAARKIVFQINDGRTARTGCDGNVMKSRVPGVVGSQRSAKPDAAINAEEIASGQRQMKQGEKIQQGQIYDSNSVLLDALLQRCGAVVDSVEHCRDERESLIEAIRRGSENHILIISGGVSVGEHDLVKAALRDLGAQIDIWRVAIKPGKPFLFGNIDKCAVFGLPGNPVSAFVTFLQFVRPAILKMMGATDLDLPQMPAKLTVDLTNDSDRAHYIRGKLEHGRFTPVGRQESHALFGLSQSNALLRLALGQSLKAGDIVEVQIWD